MDNKGPEFLRTPATPLQARRIRIIAISLPILIVSGYALFDRLMNQGIVLPVTTQNLNEGSKTGGHQASETGATSEGSKWS